MAPWAKTLVHILHTCPTSHLLTLSSLSSAIPQSLKSLLSLFLFKLHLCILTPLLILTSLSSTYFPSPSCICPTSHSSTTLPHCSASHLLLHTSLQPYISAPFNTALLPRTQASHLRPNLNTSLTSCFALRHTLALPHSPIQRPTSPVSHLCPMFHGALNFFSRSGDFQVLWCCSRSRAFSFLFFWVFSFL